MISSRHTSRGWTKPFLAVLCLFAGTFSCSSRNASAEDDNKEYLRGQRDIAFIAEAVDWIGTPYRYGGRGSDGVDCSGFVRAVLIAAGQSDVPVSSRGFADYGEKVEGDIVPGDILLFAHGGIIDHVGIAVSSDSFIHSASVGTRTGVIISSLSENYWKSSFIGARRLGEAEN